MVGSDRDFDLRYPNDLIKHYAPRREVKLGFRISRCLDFWMLNCIKSHMNILPYCIRLVLMKRLTEAAISIIFYLVLIRFYS